MWLPVLLHYLSPQLLKPIARERLEWMSRFIPAHSLGILELRLAPCDTESGSDDVDFSVRLTPPAPGWQKLSPFLPAYVERFLIDWTQAPEESCRLPALWLEFDLDGGTVVPSICAEVRHPVDPLWLVDTLLPALQGKALTTAQREWIGRCQRALPEEGRMLYAFSMLSRRTGEVRLELGGMAAEQLSDYATRLDLGWVSEILPILSDADKLTFAVDIGEALSPRVGLGASFFRSPRREPRWAALLSRLSARGLCDPEKMSSILRWSGADSAWTSPASWPLEEMGGGSYLVRSISHLKLVAWPDREPEAKAYLAFQSVQPTGSACF